MEHAICTLVEETLKLETGSVKPSDGPNTLEAWDSLGFLGILSALEKKYGAQVAAIDDLAGAGTVQDIIDILSREDIA